MNNIYMLMFGVLVGNIIVKMMIEGRSFGDAFVIGVIAAVIVFVIAFPLRILAKNNGVIK